MKKWAIIYITIAVVAIGIISGAAYYCYQTQIDKNTTNNIETKNEKNSTEMKFPTRVRQIQPLCLF